MEKQFDEGSMLVEKEYGGGVDFTVKDMPYASLNRQEVVELITFLAECLEGS